VIISFMTVDITGGKNKPFDQGQSIVGVDHLCKINREYDHREDGRNTRKRESDEQRSES